MKPEVGHSSLRKGRISTKGHVYHVTFTTLNRQPYLADLKLARRLILTLKLDEELGYTQTFAYVVMPDHVHWLFQLNKGHLAKTIKRVKSVFSLRTSTQIWDYGFYDHAIRSDESLIKVARYIVANPLRARIVEKIGDYSHWDAIWLDRAVKS